jgi:hypothetical protein
MNTVRGVKRLSRNANGSAGFFPDWNRSGLRRAALPTSIGPARKFSCREDAGFLLKQSPDGVACA